MIIMGPKKNKIKEESKKKSKEPKNAPKTSRDGNRGFPVAK